MRTIKSITRFEMVTSLFRSVVPTYTGGGIYVFCGELTNGNYFIADNSWFDVRILNGDPTEPTGESYLDIPELNWESVEWQEEHLVEDLQPGDARTFFREMLEWVLYKKPYGNYQTGDMEYLMSELEPESEH